MRKCRNWQTSKTKDLVVVTSCGFKSHLPQEKRNPKLFQERQFRVFLLHGKLRSPCKKKLRRRRTPRRGKWLPAQPRFGAVCARRTRLCMGNDEKNRFLSTSFGKERIRIRAAKQIHLSPLKSGRSRLVYSSGICKAVPV